METIAERLQIIFACLRDCFGQLLVLHLKCPTKQERSYEVELSLREADSCATFIAPDHLARPIKSKNKPWALPEIFQSVQPRVKIEGVAQCHLTSLGIAYLGFVISPYHAATVSKNGSSSQIARYTLLLPSLGSFALVKVAFHNPRSYALSQAPPPRLAFSSSLTTLSLLEASCLAASLTNCAVI